MGGCGQTWGHQDGGLERHRVTQRFEHSKMCITLESENLWGHIEGLWDTLDITLGSGGS